MILQIAVPALALGADTQSGPVDPTALLAAAAYGETEEVRRLLARGVEVDAPGPAGHTALTLAAQEGHAGVVALLLDAGADPRRTSDAGATAAKLARGWGHREVVLALERHARAGPGTGIGSAWWAVPAAAALALVAAAAVRGCRRAVDSGRPHGCGCVQSRA